MKVIPFGYGMKDSKGVLDSLLQRENHVLIDVRISTASTKRPEWSKDELRQRYGGKYAWLKSLGNANRFKPGEPTKLHKPEVGIPLLLQLLKEGYTPIIMCGCAQYGSCHRHMIVDILLQNMPELELELPELAKTI